MSRPSDLEQPPDDGGSLDYREVPAASACSFRRSEEGMEAAGVHESDVLKVNYDRVAPSALKPGFKNRRCRHVELSAETQISSVATQLAANAEQFLLCSWHGPDSPPVSAEQ